MVSIAGSKKLKRQMAPVFWGIKRKGKRFVVTVKPGGHPKSRAVPTAVLLRDMLGIVSTLREAKSAIYGRRVTIDGVVRKSLHHGIGLMDVVELEGVGDIYRMVPSEGALLAPLKIDASEKSKKICRITSKATAPGGKTQLGFHDGRSVLSEEKASVGDSCVMQVPDQKILEVIRLQKGCACIVTRGTNAGQMGTISEIKSGTFTLPKTASVQLGSRQVEMPADMVLAVGQDKPAVRVQ